MTSKAVPSILRATALWLAVSAPAIPIGAQAGRPSQPQQGRQSVGQPFPTTSRAASCPDAKSSRVHFVFDSDVNPSVCGVVRFRCGDDQVLFTSLECGCGCIDALACDNGGFEAGTFQGWSGLDGSNDVGSFTAGVAALSPPRHQIVAAGGSDPFTGSALPLVPTGGGSFAARLGDSNTAGSTPGFAERLAKTFTVSAANPELFYRYALVLEDGGHPADRQPFFQVRVLDPAGNQIHQETRVANPNDPFFQSAGGEILYRRWSCVRVPLDQYVGQDVTVEFTAADCNPGQHFGYAYIDNVCEQRFSFASFTIPDQACRESLVADGSGSTDEVNHFWSIQESDKDGNRFGPEAMQWFNGQAGTIDLTAFAAQHGLTVQCGTWYRVKLAVSTECVPWQETTKLVYVKACPKADAGPDRQVCRTTGAPTTIGAPALPGNTYTWVSSPSGFNSSQAQVAVAPKQQTEYKLTVTNPEGCSATDAVTVTPVDPGVSIAVADPSCCCCRTRTLTAQSDGATYLWTTQPAGKPGHGSTAPSLSVQPDEQTWYDLEATNACGTFTTQATVRPLQPPVGGYPKFFYPNAFTPKGKNPLFIIWHQEVPADGGPAYNACKWKFTVFDRWGGEIYHKSGEAKENWANGTPMLINGEIPRWDGRNDQGNYLPNGVYVWLLELSHCTADGGETPFKQVKTDSVTIIY